MYAPVVIIGNHLFYLFEIVEAILENWYFFLPIPAGRNSVNMNKAATSRISPSTKEMVYPRK